VSQLSLAESEMNNRRRRHRMLIPAGGVGIL